ncbi:hypothetical protein GUITHDRAFT_136754 [Guillardia theta CCMP2712]|uniref:Actin-related protein 10 n=1 Tax=Guillardia theta (strain CCMP2712) TaxID=905079 RepID=L1JI97_GUITC|nr:hypothetical protein GUITHDRAFT_136754 [Guillardia theta CCMP2712]EKX48226.1 hypothetical protein GUITHDRAFT_136754 [Guillardia theta CCMP2712]|eukprot:XP_005835206.1 hypothetical protein GUITHDRAFT_136754 [Guillardia theta CCMP2712]
MAEPAAILLELGTMYWKVGFAGEYVPRKIVPKNMLRRTAEPEKVEKALRNVFINILLCTPRGRKVVLCEKVTEQTKFRALVVSILLEKLQVDSVQFVPALVQPVYACCRDNELSGLMVDVGYSETCVLPVYHGHPLVHAMSVADVGTRTVHECLAALAGEKELVQWQSPAPEDAILDHVDAHRQAEDMDDVVVRSCSLHPDDEGHRVMVGQFARTSELLMGICWGWMFVMSCLA